MAFFDILGGLLGGILGRPRRPRNPIPAAQPFLRQVPQVAQQYLQPYIQGGLQSYNQLPELYNRAENLYNVPGVDYGDVARLQQQMALNPQEHYEELMSRYEPSGAYKFREKRALDAARNSASAGGRVGTEEDQMRQAEMVNALMSQDMQQFLENLSGIQGAGMGGVERNMQGRERGLERRLTGEENRARMGYLASADLAETLQNALLNQAGLAYGQVGQQNAYRQQRRNYLMDFLGGMHQRLQNPMAANNPFMPGGNYPGLGGGFR